MHAMKFYAGIVMICAYAVLVTACTVRMLGFREGIKAIAASCVLTWFVATGAYLVTS